MHDELSILLIDDDVELCALMEIYLCEKGLRPQVVHDGRRGLARAVSGEYDLVILDVMLPGLDGFEVLRQVRSRSAVPIIMLTARTGREDRIAGLDAGADDYLPKPFEPEELIARIRAVLRRAGGTLRPTPEVLEMNQVRLAQGSREAWSAGVPLDLTTTEYDLLAILVRSAGRTVSREELTAALYQRAVTPFDRSLDVHVAHLRKKLGSQGSLIRTVRGVGYLFQSERDPGTVEGPFP